jgi:hypothetical protein
MTADRCAPEKTIAVYWLDGPRPFLPLLVRKQMETMTWVWEKPRPTLWGNIKGWLACSSS